MAELTSLGRYKLGKVLGRGAMGVVYEGMDPSLNRRVAIKTILKNAAIDEETAQMYSAQFAREAQAAGRLNHPNIVQIHDFAEQGDIAYLVMEYIQGRELRSFFDAKEMFEPAEVVRIMGELLDALDFAHEAGVVHRDVKPANVMLDAQRRVKLADFGVARIQDSERSAAGTMVGTPAFMSPEQISGGKIDRRTDVFSAGVVFYQMLTGEQPFTGAGAWTVAKKIMQDDPPRPSSVVASVSPAFDGIVNKALAKKPADRFSSAKEFAAALRATVAGGAQATNPPSVIPEKPRAAAPKASDAEVEFWRAIQNSTDPDEIEFYLEQFPEGTYAQLARHKIAKLREPAGAARREPDDTLRLEAEARAKREAQEQAAREAEEQAKREAEERARLEAEARARKEAEEKEKREAAERAQKAAAEKAQREAQEKARQAAALAKLQREEQAARAAAAAVDPDATVAITRAPTPAARAPAAAKKSFVLPAVIGAVVVVAGVAAFLVMKRAPAPVPVAEAPVAAPAKPAPPVVDEEKIRREVEERVRREYADKSAAEQAAASKAAIDKAIQEKQSAAKGAAEKAALEKAALEKAAADKALAEKLAAAKSSGEKAALEKFAAEKAAAEKAAAERAAAERLAAEKAAADKAAAEKVVAARAPAPAPAVARAGGLPSVGDRWIYEAKEVGNAARRFTLTVEARAVNGNTVTEAWQRGDADPVQFTQRPVLAVSNPPTGIVNFPPYLRAFQELREGQKLGEIDFQRLYRCSETSSRCSVVGKVVGREKVTVRAGSFDTTKVVLELNLNTMGRGTTIEFRYWYAEAVSRYVKYEMRVDNMNFGQPSMDMELVSFAPASSRPAEKSAESAKSP